jgi:3-deoxy-D-manno-octulosonic-acid transferase
VPLVLANARLNQRSFVKTLRLDGLARPAYRALAAAWAQTESDAADFGRWVHPCKASLAT